MIPTEVDITVVGGGIQGAGVPQAAAAAGYSVLLLERTDWGAGTSSRSSKLIHGGLRYLESGQLRLVRKAWPCFGLSATERTPPQMINLGISLLGKGAGQAAA